MAIGERDASAASEGSASGRRAVGEVEAKRLLADLGLRVPEGRLVRSADEAVHAAETIGFPVVVKVASPEILHKSDVGGVALGITTAEQARAAFAQVIGAARQARPDATVEAALVEAACPSGGVEVIVGVVRDPCFGPVAMCGLGGVLVEVLGDVTFRPAPISRADAFEMLAELRGARLLDGVRGRPAVDRAALVDVLLTVAGPDGIAIQEGYELVEELDLNPVFAYSDGAIVADARIVYGPGSPTPRPRDALTPSPSPSQGRVEQADSPPSPTAVGMKGPHGWMGGRGGRGDIGAPW